ARWRPKPFPAPRGTSRASRRELARLSSVRCLRLCAARFPLLPPPGLPSRNGAREDFVGHLGHRVAAPQFLVARGPAAHGYGGVIDGLDDHVVPQILVLDQVL